MYKLFLFILFIVLAIDSYAQQEAMNWYFGKYAGITFKSGTPVALTNGALNTFEGVATISDSNGNLLFYTDGSKVYNSNNAVMPNGSGLLGNNSSAQSAVIVKKPGSETLYYVFTIDCFENSGRNGLNYSIVDMTLNGGLGDISVKNVLLDKIALEKLTVVRHKNNRDFWILINDWNDNDITAFNLSCTGINPVPVKSPVGPIHGPRFFDGIGYLKASRQNDKLAIATFEVNSFIVLDFDNSTGVASNKKVIQGTQATFGAPYGVEFSPDGNLLYGSTIEAPKLFQFNLNAGTGTDIYNSRILLATHATIFTLNAYYYGALQLGPDGRIYSANNGDTTLGVINSPNTLDTFCNYRNNIVSLKSRTCFLGLPNFLTDYAFPQPRDTVYASICQNNIYALPDGTSVDSPGIYITHLSSSTICDSIIVTKLIINAKSFSSISKSICQGQNYNGFTISGTYHDTLIAANGCDSIVTINLLVIPTLFSTINQTICEGETVSGHSISGIYIDTLISSGGCDSVRTLNLIVNQKSASSSSITICAGQNYNGHTSTGVLYDTLVAANGCDSLITTTLTVLPYQYSTIDTSICSGQNFNGYTSPGTYIDTLKSINQCDSIRTIKLSVIDKPQPAWRNNNILCTGDSLILNPGDFATYLWQDGSTNNNYTVKTLGQYSVIVGNGCDTTAISITVAEQNCQAIFPSIFSPNNDGRNDVFRVLDAADITQFHLIIFSRYGEKMFETSDYTKGWNGTYKGNPQPTGTYVWECTLSYKGKINKVPFKGTVVLTR